MAATRTRTVAQLNALAGRLARVEEEAEAVLTSARVRAALVRTSERLRCVELAL